MAVNSLQILLVDCHILSLTYLKCGTYCANKKMKTRIYAAIHQGFTFKSV